jgi:hypothetical protein
MYPSARNQFVWMLRQTVASHLTVVIVWLTLSRISKRRLDDSRMTEICTNQTRGHPPRQKLRLGYGGFSAPGWQDF